ncbi:MAG TPA: RnfABCDGE type electron transport complex subunit G [Gammaproteobacteria bacterium]|nr:RnfABCDGE type electron transport complex subunit G [Gammaproteobacteria bacterium]
MARSDGNAILTVIVAGVLLAAAVWISRSAYDATRDRIAMNERARLVARLNSVLDPALLGRDLTTTRLAYTDAELLGSANPVDVFVITDRGRPVATVIASIAPHGYNAPIDLLVGIGADGRISGVRAVRHRETPGLGDMIDRARSAWIDQFRGKALLDPPGGAWHVKQDEGQFDSITGATVTSRAVVAAVRNALLYFDQHRDDLYRAAAEAAATEHDPEP